MNAENAAQNRRARGRTCLHDQVGVKFIPNDLPFLAEYSHRRALEFQGGAGTMAQHLREVIGSNGAKVLFNTRVEKLIVEDGKVTGVEAVDGNTGTKYTIRAKKTLLTTGGYGNNKNLLTDTYKNTLYYGPVSSTGDGLQMAQKLGVKTQLLEYGKRYPNGIEVAPGKAKSTIYANVGAIRSRRACRQHRPQRSFVRAAGRAARAHSV